MPIIVCDGLDGSGKTTQSKLLYDFLSIDKKLDVELVQNPGGTELGAELRQLIKSKKYPTHKSVERLLFAADAAQLMREKLDHASPERWFVMDRWAPITDLVYAMASGVDLQMVVELQRLAGLNIRCDLYIVFKLTYEISMQRKVGRIATATTSGGIQNGACRIEDKGSDFLRRVEALYQSINRPGEMTSQDHDLNRLVEDRAEFIRSVDASKSPLEVAQQVRRAVFDAMPSLNS